LRSSEQDRHETDDDLTRFEAQGAAPLPDTGDRGYVDHDGARIWNAAYGSGRRAVLVDSRCHGRSTRDARPYTYELMASDVLAVMDALGPDRAAVVGWSEGCAAR
jgi:pimeloyl-ACP methyl ester carboxylesterase